MAGSSVSAVLLLWGVAAVIGLRLGGRLNDRFGHLPVIVTSLSVLALAFLCLSTSAALLPPVSASVPILLAIALWGVSAWSFFPAQQGDLPCLRPHPSRTRRSFSKPSRLYSTGATMTPPNRYIQHSAHIAPGRDGLFNLIRTLPGTLKYENQLIVAEGDYVIAHGRFSGNGRPAAWVAADIARIEAGRLAEHWDVSGRLADVRRPVPRLTFPHLTSGDEP
jgi:predicted SnoaL-like aldol condensation-catalyzing enzyme